MAYPIGWELLSQIKQAYTARAVREPWQSSDLLVVDDIRPPMAAAPTRARVKCSALADSILPKGHLRMTSRVHGADQPQDAGGGRPLRSSWIMSATLGKPHLLTPRMLAPGA